MVINDVIPGIRFSSNAVDADGLRFLFAERVAAGGAEQSGIHLVLNWSAGLR